MAHNNEGFDILVGSGDRPVRYVEVKSTRADEPAFIISESERLFSRTHADRHSLVVVTGIDLQSGAHGHIYWYDGGVGVEQFRLKPLQWRGRGPG